MSTKNNFKMGTVEMLVLFLLDQKDLYGYEICSLISQLSEGKYDLAETSLYPILYRLLDKQMIGSKSVLVGKRRTRVYYHINKKGRDRLHSLLPEYKRISAGIDLILSSNISDQ